MTLKQILEQAGPVLRIPRTEVWPRRGQTTDFDVAARRFVHEQAPQGVAFAAIERFRLEQRRHVSDEIESFEYVLVLCLAKRRLDIFSALDLPAVIAVCDFLAAKVGVEVARIHPTVVRRAQRRTWVFYVAVAVSAAAPVLIDRC